MIYVYVAKLPLTESAEALSNIERQAEINSISNERVRREKYYVWRLLEYAMRQSLGIDPAEVEFKKDTSGKWTCDACEFSLSHSGDALAVAISKEPVGVDIERERIKRPDAMADFILTANERREYENILNEAKEKYLIRKWCEKESAFKLQNKASFKPAQIETAEFFSTVTETELLFEKYILAVSSKSKDTVKIFSGVTF
ncbi:MAG: 4'-phosphopantetheinyl transferase superfamily protein [Clostridia bacterium]|nr:4'-phosphopantetheinyl transferase superfamily protein [Clostridia bacterium]